MTITAEKAPEAVSTKHTVHEQIVVNVPITTAYNQWTQFEHFPQFMHGVRDIRQLDATHMHWTVKIAGVKREFDTEITEQRADEIIAWQSTDGKTHAGVITFEELNPDKTMINVHFGWKPDNLADLAALILQLDDLQVKTDLKNFKELIEANGMEDGAWRGEVISEDALMNGGEEPPKDPNSDFFTNTRNAKNPEPKYGDDTVLTSQFIEPPKHEQTV